MECKPCKYCGIVPIAFTQHSPYDGWSVSIFCDNTECIKKQGEEEKKAKYELAVKKWNEKN